MKLKIHFGIVMVFLMFLGTYIEHNIAPNQQIVIQFTNDQISSDKANYAIESLKQQLQEFGAEKLQISKYNSGHLKITYYSDADVMSIRKVLSHQENFILDYSYEDNNTGESNSEKKEIYKFIVSEIQDKPLNNWDFEGTEVTELNHKSDRYYFPKVKTSAAKENSDNSGNILYSRFTISSVFQIHKGKFAYQIPEVRAGPSLFGNS